MTKEWVSALRKVYEFLDRNDKQFDLIRKIDIDSMDNKVTLEDLTFKAVDAFIEISEARNGYFYAYAGNEFLLAYSTNDSQAPKILATSDFSEGEIVTKKHTVSLISERNSTSLLKRFPKSGTLLTTPIIGENAATFGQVILESPNGLEGSSFTDQVIQKFLESLGLQLSNAIKAHNQVDLSSFYTSVSAAFFTEGLEPKSCLKEIIKYIPNMLPTFGPLRINKNPGIQILLYDPGKEYMRIIATTGQEPDITLVSINRSFCGKLIQNPEMDYYLDDPRNDPNTKFYLGKKMQTELALPIRFENKIIAILNLESEFKDAFKKPHVDRMKQARDILAPMISALKNSMVNSGFEQRSVLFAMDKYLDDLSGTLRHGTRTPASTVGLRIGEIRGHVKDQWIMEQLEVIERNFRQVIELVTEYTKDIMAFSKFGKYSIRDLVAGAVDMNLPHTLEKRHIHLELLPGPDFDVFCSLFFKHLIFDVLRNAVFSIEQRFDQKKTNQLGRVEIKIEEVAPPHNGLERELNKRCSVTIWDNGLGTEETNLPKVGKERFTTKQSGTGLGLFALRGYIENIGGSFTVESRIGEYFQVKVILEQYNPIIHGEMKSVKD